MMLFKGEGKTIYESETAIYTDYDDSSDVYNMTKGGSCDNYAEDSDDDRVWLRYNDDTDQPFGVTVFDLHRYWAGRRAELAEIVAKFLGLSVFDVDTRIKMALG